MPVQLALYDILGLGGESTLLLPYTARRALLDVRHHGPPRGGAGVLAAMAREALHYNQQEGFDGVVAKRLTSIYRPGRRTTHWIRVKHLAPRYRP